MAKTTTKSTKAKTKTTKRTTKSASARTTKATKSKAVTPNKVKVTKPARKSLLTLSNLHILGFLLLIASAIAAALLMQPLSYVVTSTHQTNDVFLGTNQTVFVSVARALFDVELRWLLIGLLALSAVLPLLYVTRLKNFYAARLANGRVLGLRWIDLAISGALMVEIVALLSGITDIMTLKLIGGLVGATAALNWLAERQNNTRESVWGAYIVSLVTGILPWIAIGTAMIHTYLYGMIRSPWYVYALAGVTLAGFLLTALNQKVYIKARQNYEGVERNYQVINLLSKVAFAVILIVGLLK